ncbi:hypothetical protein [Arthrobacter sp. NPDC056727]|uniref:hypothetical protein n=1 Tax=Arthrobacter sp. NPDC056727 TaxID=3345927 RepID=UPI00366DEBB8
MKKTALGVMALAGTVFVQLAGAAPSTASQRADVTKTVTRGQGLTAEFDRADGCMRTRVSVFGSVFTFSGTPTPDKLGFVSVTQENTCTGATLINGFGETESLNLVVSNGLSNGRLRMSMEFTNFADPDNPVVSPMTADVSFRATAHATTASTKSKSRSEGTRFESSEDTRSRPASVGGTVKLGAQSVLSRSNSSSSATVGSVVTKEKTEAR